MSRKKATKKEIENVISNLIVHVKAIEEKVIALDNVFGMYIKYTDNETGFQEFVNQKLEEAKGKETNKKRAWIYIYYF